MFPPDEYMLPLENMRAGESERKKLLEPPLFCASLFWSRSVSRPDRDACNNTKHEFKHCVRKGKQMLRLWDSRHLRREQEIFRFHPCREHLLLHLLMQSSLCTNIHLYQSTFNANGSASIPVYSIISPGYCLAQPEGSPHCTATLLPYVCLLT